MVSILNSVLFNSTGTNCKALLQMKIKFRRPTYFVFKNYNRKKFFNLKQCVTYTEPTVPDMFYENLSSANFRGPFHNTQIYKN